MERSWFSETEQSKKPESGNVTVVSRHPSWIHEAERPEWGRQSSTLSRETGFHALLSTIFPEMRKSELLRDSMFRLFLKEREAFAPLYSPIHMSDAPNRMAVDPITALDDLEWFASEESVVQRFRGKYVAIRERRVIGWGATAIEAYRMAKRTNPDAEPAITFIPERENTLF